MNVSRPRLLFAVLLPVLSIAFGIVRSELFVRRAQDFVFEIGGYDPRDLLRGHYLQFRLEVGEVPVREPCDDATRECCLCLSRREPGPVPFAERATCETARLVCDGALHTRYLREPHRYYVPEAEAQELERRLIEATGRRAAHVVLAIARDGEAHVRELRLDGKAIAGGVDAPRP